jgi:hypothetical protein
MIDYQAIQILRSCLSIELFKASLPLNKKLGSQNALFLSAISATNSY